MPYKPQGLLIVTMIIALGCAITPRKRTLPPDIFSVYVPMFKNTSFEPGVEELLTKSVVEEFLADGRLKVVQKRKADVFIEGEVTDYSVRVDSFYDDEFPFFSTAHSVAKIRVQRSIEEEKPLGSFDNVSASLSYISDPRRTTYKEEPQVKEELMGALAKRIVSEVLTGEYKK